MLARFVLLLVSIRAQNLSSLPSYSGSGALAVCKRTEGLIPAAGAPSGAASVGRHSLEGNRAPCHDFIETYSLGAGRQ
jgi:hypothetical protein